MDAHIGGNARQDCSIDKPAETVRKRPLRTFTAELEACADWRADLARVKTVWLIAPVPVPVTPVTLS